MEEKEPPLMKCAALAATALLLSACMNMPTPTSQITGAHNSGIRYENYNCSRLSTEWDSLSRRESQLVLAQEQRIKSSQIQAFWWGFGQGDGIEAAELATVRGEIEAVRKVSETKKCRLSPRAEAAGSKTQ